MNLYLLIRISLSELIRFDGDLQIVFDYNKFKKYLNMLPDLRLIFEILDG